MISLARKTKREENSSQTRIRNKGFRQEPKSPTIQSLSNEDVFIQRKGSCSCGGDCPTCEGELALQPKLKVSMPNDQYEQEADRVAEQIVSGGGYYPGETNSVRTSIQRACAGCEDDVENGESVQRKPDSQRNVKASLTAESYVKSLGTGSPLSGSEATYFEPRFGRSFGNIRIHTGEAADKAAKSINARAFTVGTNIAFANGEYDSNSDSGRKLIAHELTHTIQQSAPLSPVVRTSKSESRSSTPESITRTDPLIQREVGDSSVASSGQVLDRIGSRTARADAHADATLRTLRILNEIIPTIPGTPSEITELRAQIPEPLFGAVLGDLFRLGEMGFVEFNPGAGRDSPQNAFVYTCTCGWIDMGHFFISAALSYGLEVAMRIWSNLSAILNVASAREATIIIGWFMEHLQEAFRQFATGPMGGLLDTAPEPIRGAIMGNVRSAFTVEDLPSDEFGAQFGHQVAVALAMSSSLGFGDPEPDDIQARMSEFFADCGGAVFPTGATRRAMIEETMGPGPLPRQHFSTTPVLLTSAGGLCPAPETECPAVDERGWERSNPDGRITEESDRTTLWNFTVNAAALKVEHQERIRQAAAAAAPGAMIMVEGYASCTGSSASNERLARRRAESAVSFVRTLRPDLRIGLNYHGEQNPNPPVTAGDGEAMAKNRRVEIYVVDVAQTQFGIPLFQIPGQIPLPTPEPEEASAGETEEPEDI